MTKGIKLLQKLSNLNGPSGYELDVTQAVAAELAGMGEIRYDNLGSVICEVAGSGCGPKVMLAGHMDEIGFVVKQVTEGGFLRLSPLGGWWDQVLLAQQLTVLTSKGPVPGVIAAKPSHLVGPDERNKVVAKDKMFVDIGAKDREQATEEFGVQPGDPAVPNTVFQRMANPDMLMGKAWDDRAGVAVMIEAVRELAGCDYGNTVYGVGTVQEEVGLRGAQTSVQTVVPDVALVLETAIAGDVPGISKGPAIYLKEGSAIPNLRLRDLALATAKEAGIALQVTVLDTGGTDAGRIHLHASGVPSLVIGIPTRHLHSHSGIISFDDYLQTIKLTVELTKRLDTETVASLRPI